MTKALLEVSELRVRIGAQEPAVEPVAGVSFSIHAGETFALLGESGCGKSMTALALLGLLPAANVAVTGSVKLAGEELLTLPEKALRAVRGARIAMIFQEPMTSLNPVMTIGAQIAESVALHRRLHGADLRGQVLELLDAVGIADRACQYAAYPHQLSGGMKQRVMIAIALAGNPDLLIADEPTTALDVTIQAQVLAVIERLQRQRGMAVLLISHDLGVVAGVADRIAVMYAGQLVEQAPRAVFFRDPQHPYSRQLFAALPDSDKRDQPLSAIPGSVPALGRALCACRFAERCDRAWDACRQRTPVWFERGAGHRVRCHLGDARLSPPPPARVPTPLPLVARAADRTSTPLLSVDDLSVHFAVRRGLFDRSAGVVKAVDGVSLAIPTACTLALVGESGCGKSTVGKGILQLLKPTAGRVRFDGLEMTRLTGEALRRSRRSIQIIFQDAYAAMNPRMRVEDIVAEGLQAQGIGGTSAQRRQRVHVLFDQVGLPTEIRRRYAHELSGGQRQRICIARALALEPKLIVCDEPTSALDVSVQAQILNLLRELQARLGLSYLFISHDISVVSYLADQIAVMYLGRIVEQGSADEVLEQPRHPYTQALLAAVPKPTDCGRLQAIQLAGDLPSPAAPPSGCHFHARCRHVMPVCRRDYPAFNRQSLSHQVRCHLYSCG